MMKRKSLLKLDLLCGCRRGPLLGHYVHKNFSALAHLSIINAFYYQYTVMSKYMTKILEMDDLVLVGSSAAPVFGASCQQIDLSSA